MGQGWDKVGTLFSKICDIIVLSKKISALCAAFAPGALAIMEVKYNGRKKNA